MRVWHVVVMVMCLLLSTSCCMKQVDEWPEWARQDRASNGAEQTVQGHRGGVGPSTAAAVGSMYSDAAKGGRL